MRRSFICVFILFSIFIGDILASPPLKMLPVDHVLKVSFIQKRYLTDIPKPIVSIGNLLLWSGKGLIWKTEDPFPATTLITHKGLYQLEENQRLAVGQQGPERAVFQMMSKVLSGSFSELKEFTMTSLQPDHGKWKVSLVPTLASLQSLIFSIEVEGDNYISYITIHRSNGDRDEIVMKNHRIFSDKDVDKAMSPQEKAWFDD